jgi:hypothetical protein
MIPSLGLDRSDIATFDFAYLTAYTIGQFINGPLSDKLGPRRVVLLGMLISILTCPRPAGDRRRRLRGAHDHPGRQPVHGLGPSHQEHERLVHQKRARAHHGLVEHQLFAIGGFVATPFAALFIKLAGGDWRFAFFGPH